MLTRTFSLPLTSASSRLLKNSDLDEVWPHFGRLDPEHSERFEGRDGYWSTPGGQETSARLAGISACRARRFTSGRRHTKRGESWRWFGRSRFRTGCRTRRRMRWWRKPISAGTTSSAPSGSSGTWSDTTASTVRLVRMRHTWDRELVHRHVLRQILEDDVDVYHRLGLSLDQGRRYEMLTVRGDVVGAAEGEGPSIGPERVDQRCGHPKDRHSSPQDLLGLDLPAVEHLVRVIVGAHR